MYPTYTSMTCLVRLLDSMVVEAVSKTTVLGVIANVRDGGDVRDIELVRNLVQTYISRPSCLILLVVSCESECHYYYIRGINVVIQLHKPILRIKELVVWLSRQIQKVCELLVSSIVNIN
jgi:hypothetical protein